MDFLIKNTISKFSATGKEKIDLSKISTLLDIHLSSLIMKLQKWIAEGSLKGSIDKMSAIFYPTIAEQKLLVDTGSIPIKQAEFVKTETRETSQEDLVKLIVNLGYTGSNIRLGIKAINKSDFDITEVNVKILYKKIKLFRIKPKYDIDQLDSGINIKLPEIKKKDQLTFSVFFISESIGMGEIKGQFQYVNYKDFVRFIRIEKLFYDLDPPKIIPKQISLDEIENYSKNKSKKKDIRSYGLPDNLNPLSAFNHVIQIIRQYNFKLITKMEQSNQLIAWFFGETDNHEFDAMVIGQIVNKKIEFYASCSNEQIISALLTAFSIDLKKRIINSHVVEDEDEIYDLYCEECSGVLPYFPKPDEKIKCKYCSYEQIVR